MKKFILFLFVFSVVQFFLNADSLDLPPKSGQIPAINIGSYQKLELENGLKIFHIEDNKLPLVTIYLHLEFTPPLEKEKAGIAEITAKLIQSGSKSKNKDKIDEELDFMGSGLEFGKNYVVVSTMKKYLTETVGIFSGLLLEPSFDGNEFERIKKEYITYLQSEKTDPYRISGNAVKSLLYGKDHPYGEIITEESVSKITIEDCKNYYSTYFRPNIGYMALVGNISDKEIKEISEKFFLSWEKGNIPVEKLKKVSIPEKTRIFIVDRPESVQTVLNLSFPIKLKPGTKRSIRSSLMNTILGGGGFRLFQNLREKNGLTYGAYSNLEPDKIVGSFQIYADVKTSLVHKAISEIIKEIHLMKETQVKPDELQMAKNYISGVFALSLEKPESIGMIAIKTAVYKLEDSFFQDYLKVLHNSPASYIQKLAKKYLYPENANIVLVGNKKEILKSLKNLKNYEIVLLDEYGNELKKK